VIGDVRRIQVDDADEAWEREVDDEVRTVEAYRIDFVGGWQVMVEVMEFVREEPLEGYWTTSPTRHAPTPEAERKHSLVG
jgi:hypothetical protein